MGLMIHSRCMATPDNLDGGGVPHSNLLADVLKHAFSLVELWDEQGMDVEIKVQSLDFRCDLDSLQLQPFTDKFPPATIYLLLAPDILHQLIKGTFKDHLVEWVTKYLEQTHGNAGAKEILADIHQQ